MAHTYVVTSGAYEKEIEGVYLTPGEARAKYRELGGGCVIEVWGGDRFIRTLECRPKKNPNAVSIVLENMEQIETPFGTLCVVKGPMFASLQESYDGEEKA